MANKLWLQLAVVVACTSSCFGMLRDPARRFYVLHVPREATEAQAGIGAVQKSSQVVNDSLVRVRDLDCESAYDKFQMVVRRSPFELTYRNKDVWAVKPGRMVSDLFARGLQQKNVFAGVTRELGERRPDWLVSGDLHVIEIEQMTSDWHAHVAVTLQVSNVDSGDITWSGHFEEREPVPAHDYALAAEAMSRALARALTQAFDSIAHETAAFKAVPTDGPWPSTRQGPATNIPVGESSVPKRVGAP